MRAEIRSKIGHVCTPIWQEYDHGLLAVTWTWHIRVLKGEPRPDFNAISNADWTTFDRSLQSFLLHGLIEEERQVGESQQQLFDQ